MISKELLSEVLGFEIRDLDLSSINSNHLNYLNVGDDWWYNINIYELAHKCKEWAVKKGYYLYTWQREKSSTCSIKAIINRPPFVDEVGLYNMDTEPEAIFKACEWLRKQ